MRMADAVCAAVQGASLSHLVYVSSDAVYPQRAALIDEKYVVAETGPRGAILHRLARPFDPSKDG